MADLVKELISNISSDKELSTLQKLSTELLSVGGNNHTDQNAFKLDPKGKTTATFSSNVLPEDKFSTGPNCNSLQTTILNLMKVSESSLNG